MAERIRVDKLGSYRHTALARAVRAFFEALQSDDALQNGLTLCQLTERTGIDHRLYSIVRQITAELGLVHTFLPVSTKSKINAKTRGRSSKLCVSILNRAALATLVAANEMTAAERELGSACTLYVDSKRATKTHNSLPQQSRLSCWSVSAMVAENARPAIELHDEVKRFLAENNASAQQSARILEVVQQHAPVPEVLQQNSLSDDPTSASLFACPQPQQQDTPLAVQPSTLNVDSFLGSLKPQATARGKELWHKLAFGETNIPPAEIGDFLSCVGPTVPEPAVLPPSYDSCVAHEAEDVACGPTSENLMYDLC